MPFLGPLSDGVDYFALQNAVREFRAACAARADAYDDVRECFDLHGVEQAPMLHRARFVLFVAGWRDPLAAAADAALFAALAAVHSLDNYRTQTLGGVQRRGPAIEADDHPSGLVVVRAPSDELCALDDAGGLVPLRCFPDGAAQAAVADALPETLLLGLDHAVQRVQSARRVLRGFFADSDTPSWLHFRRRALLCVGPPQAVLQPREIHAGDAFANAAPLLKEETVAEACKPPTEGKKKKKKKKPAASLKATTGQPTPLALAPYEPSPQDLSLGLENDAVVFEATAAAMGLPHTILTAPCEPEFRGALRHHRDVDTVIITGHGTPDGVVFNATEIGCEAGAADEEALPLDALLRDAAWPGPEVHAPLVLLNVAYAAEAVIGAEGGPELRRGLRRCCTEPSESVQGAVTQLGFYDALVAGISERLLGLDLGCTPRSPPAVPLSPLSPMSPLSPTCATVASAFAGLADLDSPRRPGWLDSSAEASPKPSAAAGHTPSPLAEPITPHTPGLRGSARSSPKSIAAPQWWSPGRGDGGEGGWSVSADTTALDAAVEALWGVAAALRRESARQVRGGGEDAQRCERVAEAVAASIDDAAGALHVAELHRVAVVARAAEAAHTTAVAADRAAAVAAAKRSGALLVEECLPSPVARVLAGVEGLERVVGQVGAVAATSARSVEGLLPELSALRQALLGAQGLEATLEALQSHVTAALALQESRALGARAVLRLGRVALGPLQPRLEGECRCAEEPPLVLGGAEVVPVATGLVDAVGQLQLLLEIPAVTGPPHPPAEEPTGAGMLRRRLSADRVPETVRVCVKSADALSAAFSPRGPLPRRRGKLSAVAAFGVALAMYVAAWLWAVRGLRRTLCLALLLCISAVALAWWRLDVGDAVGV